MDSNSTRSRSDRLQLSVLLDASLVVALRSAARQRGVTLASLVERALEVELDGYVDVGPGGGGGAAAQSGDERSDRGRDRVDGSVSPDDRRRVAPDWDAILAAGRQGKVLVPDRDTVSQALDPLEEIA